MNRPVVCVDLDGVLVKYEGWKGPGVLGEPFDGAVDFIHELSRIADVVIFTVRLNRDVSGQVDPRLWQAEHDGIRKWLDENGFEQVRLATDRGKPIAVAYVDDRAVVCKPDFDDFPRVTYACSIIRVMCLLAEHKSETPQAIAEAGDKWRASLKSDDSKSPQPHALPTTSTTEQRDASDRSDTVPKGPSGCVGYAGRDDTPRED